MTSMVATADVRTAEILGNIRLTFAEKGFDGASMQDLARAAGMSVGNFYRYFPSKAAMIEAIVLRDMIEMEEDFARILKSSDPMHQLRVVMIQHITGKDCATDSSLWAEISAAALRKPEIASIVARMESRVEANLLNVFARTTNRSEADARKRFLSHARFLIMLVQSASLDFLGAAADAPDLIGLFERTIDRTLNEISNADPKV